MNTISRTKLTPATKIREYYKIEKGLFGLLSYEVIVKQESTGDILMIEAEREPDEIYFNGELIKTKK